VRRIGCGWECRVRLPDGTPDEAILSAEEAAALIGQKAAARTRIPPADAEKVRLLVESARIRLAYAHDRHFAVSLSGIRTLPHQIEAVYLKMLPQPRLRFLLADDPGAGKTIMAGLLVKELKLREAIECIRTVLTSHPWRAPSISVMIGLQDVVIIFGAAAVGSAVLPGGPGAGIGAVVGSGVATTISLAEYKELDRLCAPVLRTANVRTREAFEYCERKRMGIGN